MKYLSHYLIFFFLAELNIYLPDPDVLAAEIIENMEAGLESFKTIVAALNK